ncbi:type II toxin-antitoxin system VapC family toxin [Devosia crocina]
MLDTNIASALVKEPHSGPVRDKLFAYGTDRVCISIVTASELRFGLEKNPSVKLATNLDLILNAIDIVPFDAPADEHYASIRWALSRTGRVIGPNDLFIAAHARALDLVLVTANVREFSRVPGLAVENWLD